MTIFHPRLLLAICGAACLIAFTPQWRRPPAELAAIDKQATAALPRRMSTPRRRRPRPTRIERRSWRLPPA